MKWKIFVLLCVIFLGCKEQSYDKKFSPQFQLASILQQSATPDPNFVIYFKTQLGLIKTYFPDRTTQEIANGLVAAYDLSKQEGYNRSLLEYTTEYSAFLEELKYKLPYEDSLAFFAKMIPAY